MRFVLVVLVQFDFPTYYIVEPHWKRVEKQTSRVLTLSTKLLYTREVDLPWCLARRAHAFAYARGTAHVLQDIVVGRLVV